MNTYIFVERDGSGTMTLSADGEREAWSILRNMVRDNDQWRLDQVENEDGKTPKDLYKEDFPEDARARTFDGGF